MSDGLEGQTERNVRTARPPRLIVGLGNPGREYAYTRHNAGQWFVETLADQMSVTLAFEKKFSAKVGRTKVGDRDVWFSLPQTYMNNSGQSVAAIVKFYKIEPSEMLIVHDELDLPIGAVRLKMGGGNGGHNGLRSVDTQLGNRDYWRLRIGIDHPGDKSLVTTYVLKAPPIEAFKRIVESFSPVFDNMNVIFSGDFASAMQNLHQKKS